MGVSGVPTFAMGVSGVPTFAMGVSGALPSNLVTEDRFPATSVIPIDILRLGVCRSYSVLCCI